MTEQKTLSKKLLVEGNDDKHVVLALCKKYAIAETFDVVDCKGIENLFEQIPIWFKISGIDTIGVIVDADIDLNTRWDTIKNLLKPHGFSSATEGLPDTGLIIGNGIQTFGVWIMPNNNTNGMLEDFISLLVPDSDKLLPIANTILKEIEEKKLNLYSKTHQSKALIHTWLAWQENPGTPLGLSITKKYLSHNSAVCEQFIEWLTKLFDQNTISPCPQE